MYITDIEEQFIGDTYFPTIQYDKWKQKTILTHQKDEQNPHNFTIKIYEKKY